MTVYVLQNQRKEDKVTGEFVPRFDLSPAEKFGKIEFILSPTAKPFINPTIILDLHKKLEHFGNDDYLLLIGNPALIGMATAIAAWWNDGNIKVLQWSGADKEYISVEVCDLFQEIETDSD